MRKKVHIACTVAAVVFCTVCILGVIPTWWLAAIIYALAMIFLVLAFSTSKKAKEVMTEKPKRKPVDYVNRDNQEWTECYMIALQKEIEDAQM